MISYRWIDGDELSILEPVMSAKGWVPLNYPTSRALCAFHGEKLVGFVVLQLYPHTEPLYVEPQYRGVGIAEELADQMVAFINSIRARGVMVVADHPSVIELCESRGWTKLDHPVYVMRGNPDKVGG